MDTVPHTDLYAPAAILDWQLAGFYRLPPEWIQYHFPAISETRIDTAFEDITAFKFQDLVQNITQWLIPYVQVIFFRLNAKDSNHPNWYRKQTSLPQVLHPRLVLGALSAKGRFGRGNWENLLIVKSPPNPTQIFLFAHARRVMRMSPLSETNPIHPANLC
ncbi:MAG: hypothetical protein IPJ30_25205 [Acidobacteria bacterium]|nr:hypothetical protein [Acidobacteriota bacterium]